MRNQLQGHHGCCVEQPPGGIPLLQLRTVYHPLVFQDESFAAKNLCYLFLLATGELLPGGRGGK